MKTNIIFRNLLLLITMTLLISCGNAAPVTPIQIPTSVSFATSNFEDGFVSKMLDSVSLTADGDCSNCQFIFTNSGQVVTDDSCGTVSFTNTTGSITGPDTWPPNSICSVAAQYAGSDLLLQVSGASTSQSASLNKADHAASASTSLTEYIDISIERINSALTEGIIAHEITDIGDNLIIGDIASARNSNHVCLLSLTNVDDALVANTVLYGQADNFDATQTTIATYDPSVITLVDCRIGAYEDVLGNNTIGVIIVRSTTAEEKAAGEGDRRVELTTYDGSSWSSPIAVATDLTDFSYYDVAVTENGTFFVGYVASGTYLYIKACSSTSCSTGQLASEMSYLSLTEHNNYAYIVSSSVNDSGFLDAVIKVYDTNNSLIATYTIPEAGATEDIDFPVIAVSDSGNFMVAYALASTGGMYGEYVDISDGSRQTVTIEASSSESTTIPITASVSAAENQFHFYYFKTDNYHKLSKVCSVENNALTCSNALDAGVLSWNFSEFNFATTMDGRMQIIMDNRVLTEDFSITSSSVRYEYLNFNL